MRSSRIGFVAAAAAAFLWGAVVSAAAGQEQASDRLARQIVGWWDGVAGPANHVRVIVQPGRPVTGQPSTYQFEVTLQGKYNDTNVSLVGAPAIEPQGDGARLQWATQRSIDCQVDIHPAGDGFEGTTGANACQSAFQSPTPGRWEFQMEPGSF